MKLTIKSLVYSDKLSHDSTAYSATILVDGAVAFKASNSGKGAITDVFVPLTRNGKELLAQAQAWAKVQPPVQHPDLPTPTPSTLELQIEMLVMNERRIRYERRKCKIRTLIQVEGTTFGQYIEYSRPYDEEMKQMAQKKYPNCRIVNEDYL